jgi:prepilin signal peptidase PulO-like enzyme (type II secretory pathway)
MNEYLTIAVTVVFFAFLLYLSWHDVKNLSIPSTITYVFFAVVLIFSGLRLYNATGIEFYVVRHQVISGAIIFTSLYVLHIATKGRYFGIGDNYIISAITLMFGLISALWTVAIASWLGSLYAMYLFVQKKQVKGTRIPLVPLLSIGSLLVVLINELLR